MKCMIYIVYPNRKTNQDRYVIRVLDMTFTWLHVFHISFIALTFFSCRFVGFALLTRTGFVIGSVFISKTNGGNAGS